MHPGTGDHAEKVRKVDGLDEMPVEAGRASVYWQRSSFFAMWSSGVWRRTTLPRTPP
jgi:hypothetical protein